MDNLAKFARALETLRAPEVQEKRKAKVANAAALNRLDALSAITAGENEIPYNAIPGLVQHMRFPD